MIHFFFERHKENMEFFGRARQMNTITERKAGGDTERVAKE